VTCRLTAAECFWDSDACVICIEFFALQNFGNNNRAIVDAGLHGKFY
jgi:hypothetical protein